VGFRLGLLVCLVCVCGEREKKDRRRNRIVANAKQAMVDVNMVAVSESQGAELSRLIN
jgi:hypothetical protein